MSKEEIFAIREWIKARHRRYPTSYDEKAYVRIQLETKYVLRFLRAAEWNVQEACLAVNDVLKWRRAYEVTSITPSQVSSTFFERAQPSSFVREEKDTVILVVRLVLHKDMEDAHNIYAKFLIILLETLEERFKDNNVELELILDARESSVVNLTMDLHSFKITTLALAYPGLFRYTIVYSIPNMAWNCLKVAQAVFKNIITFLSEKEVATFLGDRLKSKGSETIFEDEENNNSEACFSAPRFFYHFKLNLVEVDKLLRLKTLTYVRRSSLPVSGSPLMDLKGLQMKLGSNQQRSLLFNQ